MSKWMICPKRSKSCGDCKHARKHLMESDCKCLTMCPVEVKYKNRAYPQISRCEPTTPPANK